MSGARLRRSPHGAGDAQVEPRPGGAGGGVEDVQVVEDSAVGRQLVRPAAEEPEPIAEDCGGPVLSRQRLRAGDRVGEVGPRAVRRVVGVEAVDVHWRALPELGKQTAHRYLAYPHKFLNEKCE